MAVALRLTRHGCKKSPFYRIVAADSREARDGKFLEVVGFYNPLKTEPEVTINKDRVLYWVKNGAKVSPTVKTILEKQGINK